MDKATIQYGRFGSSPEDPEVEVREKKERVAKRVPPGDRWEPLFGTLDSEELVFESLTDILEYIFQEQGSTQFYMDAREGYVYTVQKEEVKREPQPTKKYSLYGER